MNENSDSSDIEIEETIAEAAVHASPTEYSKIAYVIELDSVDEATFAPETRQGQDETEPVNPCPPPADPT